MSLASNIARRSGSARYYARLGVPLDLQGILKKRELWQSLGTTDPKLAREKVLPVLVKWRSEFAELRKRRAPTDADLQGAVWSHYQAELEDDRRGRAALPTSAQITDAQNQLLADVGAGKVTLEGGPLVEFNATLDVRLLASRAEITRDFRARRMAELRGHLAKGEIALVQHAADEVIRRDSLLIDRGGSAYRDLCQRLQRAELEALQRAEERDDGNWSGSPKDSMVKPPQPFMSEKLAAPGETIMELFDRFNGERKGSTDCYDLLRFQ
jgi:hypothetical protein